MLYPRSLFFSSNVYIMKIWGFFFFPTISTKRLNRRGKLNRNSLLELVNVLFLLFVLFIFFSLYPYNRNVYSVLHDCTLGGYPERTISIVSLKPLNAHPLNPGLFEAQMLLDFTPCEG